VLHKRNRYEEEPCNFRAHDDCYYYLIGDHLPIGCNWTGTSSFSSQGEPSIDSEGRQDCRFQHYWSSLRRGGILTLPTVRRRQRLRCCQLRWLQSGSDESE